MHDMLQIKRSKPISFSLDTLARAMYITFSNNPIARTVRKNSSFAIDYDKDNKLVGIEIIRLKHVSATISKVLKDAESVLPPKCKEVVENLIPA